MGRTFFRDVDIGAGSQFLGTEFAAMAKNSEYKLVVREIRIKMGSELKSWQIRKRYTSTGTFGVVSSIHFQSVDGSGVPGANNDTDVVVNGDDAARIELLSGEQVQITTSGATAAMHCRVTFEEVPNDPAPRSRDPKPTR